MNTFDNINVNGCVKVAAAGVWLTGQHARVWWRLSFSAANEPSTKFSQLRRRPLLELSPGWKCLLALPHSIHNKHSMLNRRLNMVSRHNCDADTKIIHNGREDWLAFSLSPMIFELVSLVGAFSMVVKTLPMVRLQLYFPWGGWSDRWRWPGPLPGPATGSPTGG